MPEATIESREPTEGTEFTRSLEGFDRGWSDREELCDVIKNHQYTSEEIPLLERFIRKQGPKLSRGETARGGERHWRDRVRVAFVYAMASQGRGEIALNVMADIENLPHRREAVSFIAELFE